MLLGKWGSKQDGSLRTKAERMSLFVSWKVHHPCHEAMIWNNLSEQCLEILAEELKKKLYMRKQYLEVCYNGEHTGHFLLAKTELQKTAAK